MKKESYYNFYVGNFHGNNRYNIMCNVYFSKKEQSKFGSLCYFSVKKGEVLFEIVEVEKETSIKNLMGFRIYNKKDINQEDLKNMLQKDGVYFNKEIDEKFEYLCD